MAASQTLQIQEQRQHQRWSGRTCLSPEAWAVQWGPDLYERGCLEKSSSRVAGTLHGDVAWTKGQNVPDQPALFLRVQVLCRLSPGMHRAVNQGRVSGRQLGSREAQLLWVMALTNAVSEGRTQLRLRHGLRLV